MSQAAAPGSPPEGDLVLDVSLTCAWCFADEASPEAWSILKRLENAQAWVPALWLWETGNVLLQAERRGRITPAAIRRFLGLLETLPITIDRPRIASAWHDTLALAQSHRLTSDDAAYLELALRLGLPLASCDRALNQGAQLEGVLLISF